MDTNKTNNKSAKKGILVSVIAASFIVSSIVGGTAGFLGAGVFGNVSNSIDTAIKYPKAKPSVVSDEKIKIVNEESQIIDTVKKVNPTVVSIIITKDLPKIETNPFGDFFSSPFDFNLPRGNGSGDTGKVEVGGGTGFLISSDGTIITNGHVVEDKDADYTVLMNDGSKYKAKVVAKDTVKDIAIIKIEKNNLPTAELGDSDTLQSGQIAIAIGNALGEFRNTVSVGVISGLKRSIIASGSLSRSSERLSGLIQTDAAINRGNSGGPLLNSSGQVIGINVAIAADAQGIGFAIPINDAKKIVSDVENYGRIIRPYLGIRYLDVTKDLVSRNNLSVDHGALIVRGEKPGELAVIPGSPADKAGLVENDIILEIDGKKIDEDNTVVSIVQKHNVGDELTLKVFHRGEQKTVKAKLEEQKQ